LISDNTIEKILEEIKIETSRLEEMMDSDIDTKYLYIMLGKIHGMIKILKRFR